MFDGMFRLLKLEAKLAFALVALAIAVLTAVARGLAWLFRKSSRREPGTQEPTALSRSPPQPTSSTQSTKQISASAQPQSSPVNVYVTVNNAAPVPSPKPVSTPSPQPSLAGQSVTSPPAPVAASGRNPAAVLRSPDNGIYLVTGSSFIVAHPYAGDLLKQLDKMIYVGAHRRGAPFTLPVDLDNSTPLPGMAQISAVVKPDDGMMEVVPRPLPAVDNQVWVARYQRDFERQVSN